MAIPSPGTDRIGLTRNPDNQAFQPSKTGRMVWVGQVEEQRAIEVISANQLGLYSQASAFDYKVTLKFSGLLKAPESSQHGLRMEYLAALLHWIDEGHVNLHPSVLSFEQLSQVRQILEAELVQSQAWLSKSRGTDGQ